MKKDAKKIIYLVLLCIIFGTYNFLAITFSRYVSSFNVSNEVEIAKWDVSTDISDNESDILNIIIGNSVENYKIKITNNSEVKVIYSIVLSNLPNSVEVSLDGMAFKTPINNTIEFNAGTINANSANRTNEHILSFRVPINSSEIILNEIDIDVKFEQVGYFFN